MSDIYIAKGYIMDVADNALRSIRILQDGGRKIAPEDRALGFEGRSPRVVVEELLDERQHYEAIMHNVGDGIIETDDRHVVVYVNPAGRRIINKPEMNMIGNNIAEYVTHNRTKQQQNSDDNDSHKHQNQRVFYQPLTFFTR